MDSILNIRRTTCYESTELVLDHYFHGRVIAWTCNWARTKHCGRVDTQKVLIPPDSYRRKTFDTSVHVDAITWIPYSEGAYNRPVEGFAATR